MAGPVRIAILANGAQARSEFAQTGASGVAMGRKFSVAGALLKGGLVTGALAAVGGVVALGKASIDAERQFSQSMNLIRAATDAPAARMGQLSDLAIRLGTDTAFSANEAADAMLELAKAGLTTKQIMGGGVEGTLTLAAAGGTELATAATIASNAMNAFNLEGRDMNKVAAALAGGANASSASVESLGQGLAQVGPGAVNAGLSLQETVAALSAFDAAGIKGSDAGTSLKTMLARLVPSTEAARTAMSDLGLDFTKANGEFVSLEDVAGQLQSKLGTLNAEQRAQALQTIFGSDATRAATVLFREGAGGIREYIAAASDQNAAQEMAEARMEGTAGALERLSGAADTAKLAIGQGLAPAVEASANALSAGIESALGFGDAMKKALKAPNGTGDTILTQIAESGQDFLTFLGKVKDGAAAGFGELGESIANVMSEHGPMIRQLTKLVGSLGGKLAELGGTAVGGYIKFTLDAIGEGFELLADTVKFAGNIFFDFSGAVLAATGTVVETITSMTSTVIDGFLAVAEAADAIPGIDLTDTIDSIESTRDSIKGFGRDFKTTTDGVRADLNQQQYLWNLTDRQAARYRNVLLTLPDEVKTAIKTPGAVDSFTDVRRLSRQYDLTADQVITTVRATGVNLSLDQMKQLIRRYDLTPKQVRTLLKTQGIEPSLAGLTKLQNRYGLNPKQLQTIVKLAGIDVSRKDLANLDGDLKKTHNTKTNPKVTTDTGSANADLDRLIAHLAQVKSKSVTITTNLVTNRISGSGGGGGGGGDGRLLDPSLGADDGRALADAVVDGLARGRRDLQKAGKKSLAAILSGLTSSSQLDRALGKIEKALDRKLGDKALKAALKALRDETRELKEQGKLLDRNNERLDKARQKLKDLVQQARDYSRGIKDSVVAYGSVVGLGVDQETGAVSLTALLSDLEDRAYQAKLYADALKLLERAGLNDFSLQQLIDAGVEGGYATANAILQGGQSAIDQVNDLAGQIADVGSGLGDAMSEHFFAAGIEAAEGIVKGLEQQRKKLRKVMEGLADDLLDALRKRLAKGGGNGNGGGDGKNRLALGIDETHARRQGARLATALQDGFAQPKLDASLAVQGGRTGPSDSELLRREVVALRAEVALMRAEVVQAVDDSAVTTGQEVRGGIDDLAAGAWRRGGGSR